MNKVRAYLPALLVSLHLLMGIAFFGIGSAALNEGRLVYTLDDAYIHMAIAKNLVRHGEFGTTPHAFTSATSSPLWTLLIALSYAVFGVHEAAPFILAGLAAILCVTTADRLAARAGLGPWPRVVVGLALVYLTPLCTLVSTGLEHGLHILWVLLLLGLTADTLAAPPRAGRTAALCAVSFLATGTRYESLFLIFPLALVMAAHRRFRPAILALASALAPVILYGIVSLAHGSEFLPNSLLLKGNFAGVRDVSSFFDFVGMRGIRSLRGEPHLLALTVALLGAFALRRSPRPALAWLQAALVVAIVGHLQFARTGWFYRYEAYLVAAAIFLLCLELPSRLATAVRRHDGAGRRDRVAAGLALALVPAALCLLLPRGRQAWRDLLPASHDVYEQQYQMGRFFAAMLPDGGAVAVNDLGAVSFFADRPNVDLWGLGSIEVARMKRQGRYDTAAIAAVLAQHDVKYVCVYLPWFCGDQALPAHLIRVGSWRNPIDASGGGHTVTFLATDEASAWRLAYALHDFAPRLPWSVYCRIFLPDNRGGRGT